jgi:hypothetical protein
LITLFQFFFPNGFSRLRTAFETYLGEINKTSNSEEGIIIYIKSFDISEIIKWSGTYIFR